MTANITIEDIRRAILFIKQYEQPTIDVPCECCGKKVACYIFPSILTGIEPAPFMCMSCAEDAANQL